MDIAKLATEFFKGIQPKKDDDFVDRLNYYYTVLILIGCAITIGSKQYVGQPLQCFVPAEFKGAWEQYTEGYCYVENTYFVPMNDSIPDGLPERGKQELSYYQWIPIVLALQALLFHIPHLIWEQFHWQSGINTQSIVEAAESVEINKEKEKAGLITNNMKIAIDLQQSMKEHSGTLMGFGTSNGYFVTVIYLLCKLLFLINLAVQFVILNAFIGSKYMFWGAQMLNDIVRGREWEDSGHFPRVTLCDFDVRALGHVRHYSVQCVLMINFINEKIYIFLWWWLVIVFAVTAVNFIYWLFSTLIAARRIAFIKHYLAKGEKEFSGSAVRDKVIWSVMVENFATKSLRLDTVLVLRLMSRNSSDLIVSEVINQMWDNYVNEQKEIALAKRHEFEMQSVTTGTPSSMKKA